MQRSIIQSLAFPVKVMGLCPMQNFILGYFKVTTVQKSRLYIVSQFFISMCSISCHLSCCFYGTSLQDHIYYFWQKLLQVFLFSVAHLANISCKCCHHFSSVSLPSISKHLHFHSEHKKFSALKQLDLIEQYFTGSIFARFFKSLFIFSRSEKIWPPLARWAKIRH